MLHLFLEEKKAKGHKCQLLTSVSSPLKYAITDTSRLDRPAISNEFYDTHS